MSFLKPRKAEPSQTNIPTRMFLPTESSIRDLKGIKDLLATAGDKRGCLVELPWTTDVASQLFTLTVQWDKSAMNPIWTLYEKNETESKTVWSQPFSPGEMDFMYDVLAFSAGGASKSSVQIPDSLKPGFSAEQDADDKGKAEAAPAKTVATAEKSPAAPSANAPVDVPAQAPNYPQPGPPMGYPPGMAMPPGYPYPPMQMPPYAPPPGMPYGAPPYGQPMMTPPPYPMPPQNWQYNSPAPMPGTAPGIVPNIDPAAGFAPSMPNAVDMLEKKPGILIGSLLTKAELITEPTLEAALKIQDLVKNGRLTPERAPEILKMLFSMGASIEDYIDPKDLLTVDAKKAPGGQAARDTGIKAPREVSMLAYDLLIKAGLLKEEDLNAAQKVCAKHGGNIKSVLEAAGKSDGKTVEAAFICVDLERQGVMKVEKCIIALNYCSRSRVTFDEAMEELGWDNPHKSK
jgi:hypothetical protein